MLPGNAASFQCHTKVDVFLIHHRNSSCSLFFEGVDRFGSVNASFSPHVAFWQQDFALQRWVWHTIPNSDIWWHFSHFLRGGMERNRYFVSSISDLVVSEVDLLVYRQ